MKTITITTYRRPHYLREGLASIEAAKPEGYILCFGIEPGCDEIVQIARGVQFIETRITINPQILGVRRNPYTTLRRVFKEGSTFNIYLEEDVVISPDTFFLASWFQALPERDRYVCLSLFNYESREGDEAACVVSKRLAPLGMGITEAAWKQWFKPNWRSDERSRRVYGPSCHGWDWSMAALLAEEKDLKTVTPLLSRSNHIGRLGGYHCSPEYHDRTFSHLSRATAQGPLEYRIIQEGS
jgi:hypothetical protein